MWRKLDHGMLHGIKVVEVCAGAVNGIVCLKKAGEM